MNKRMMKKKSEIIRCIKNSEIMSGNRARYILSSINRDPSIVECLGEWDNEFIPSKNLKIKNRYRFFINEYNEEKVIEIFSDKGEYFNGCSSNKILVSLHICRDDKFLQAWYASPSHLDAYHKLYQAYVLNRPRRNNSIWIIISSIAKKINLCYTRWWLCQIIFFLIDWNWTSW